MALKNTPTVAKLKKLEKLFCLYKEFEMLCCQFAESDTQNRYMILRSSQVGRSLKTVTVNFEDPEQVRAVEIFVIALQSIYRNKSEMVLSEMHQIIESKYYEKSAQERVKLHWSPENMLNKGISLQNRKGLKSL